MFFLFFIIDPYQKKITDFIVIAISLTVITALLM